MADEASQAIQAALDLERELVQLLGRVGALERYRVAGVEQGLAALWSSPSSTCVTTIEGTVRGEDLLPLAGSSARVVGAGSGIDYGTFAAAAGTFSAALTVDGADVAAGLDLFLYGPGPRFDQTVSFLVGVDPCATSNYSSTGPADDIAPAAPGYCHFTGGIGSAPCDFPFKRTLTLDDSVYGSGVTLTCPLSGSAFNDRYSSGSWRDAPTSAKYTFFFGSSGPEIDISQPGQPGTGSSSPTSLTCPDAGSTLMSMTWAIAPCPAYPSGGTIHIYET